MKKYFSPSADRNKESILSALTPELNDGHLVLEIGSGTGQHACFFANECPNVIWQPTELEHNILAVNSWTTKHMTGNIRETLVLDVDVHPWPTISANICYTCNTLHIMSMLSVSSFFKGSSTVLGAEGKLCVYGPFSIDGEHISRSNALFDQQLRASDPASGVRDLTELNSMAQQHGFASYRYTALPANNYFVVWDRLPC